MAFPKLLSTLILLSLAFTATAQTTAQSPEPSQDLLNAAENLSNSGYTSMSLTIQLLLYQPQSPLLFSSSPISLTVFSPPDSAFATSGQPSLSVLLLHFSPISISQHSLQSLPFSSTIPTLSPASTPLYITTSPLNPAEISINNVTIDGSPLYDDGSVVIYAVDGFFSPNFTLVNPEMKPTGNPDCEKFSVFSRYKEASGVLKSRGYSIIASFLELQLAGYVVSDSFSGMNFTVFAPLDEVMLGFSGDFLDYKKLFFRHLLPCKLSWSELNGLKNETVFGDSAEGYGIKVTRSDNGEVRVNGVRISAPGIYEDEWIVIHGLPDVIPEPETLDGDDADEEDILKDEGKVTEADAERTLAPKSQVEF